jgi:hypothetical protein
LDNIADLRLFTQSHNQGYIDDIDAGIWSWFDIAVLDSPKSTQPKVVGGRALVWESHKSGCERRFTEQEGLLFDRQHELLHVLEVYG